MKTPSTFTATQTYDQITVNKINYVFPQDRTINLGGSIVGTNVINIGNSIIMSDNHVILGNNSGNNNSISQNNVYIGHGITHLSSNTYSNSSAIGNNSIISSSNTIFLGTSTQQVQLYNPVISSQPTFDYIIYPTLISSQAGFQRKYIKTNGVFTNVLVFSYTSNTICSVNNFRILHRRSKYALGVVSDILLIDAIKIHIANKLKFLA